MFFVHFFIPISRKVVLSQSQPFSKKVQLKKDFFVTKRLNEPKMYFMSKAHFYYGFDKMFIL